MALVYSVTNTTIGKQYIGFTKGTLAVRRDQHERAALREAGNQRAFHGALRKYGLDVFVWSVLFEGTRAEALALEKRTIAERNTRVPQGYNLSEGGESPEWHEQSRQRMSEAALHSLKAQAHRARMAADSALVARRAANAGAARRRLSDAQEDEVFVRYQAGSSKLELSKLMGVSGRCVDAAVLRAAARANAAPRNPQERTEEWRRRIGAKHAGKVIRDETRAQMSVRSSAEDVLQRLRSLAKGQRKLRPDQEADFLQAHREGKSQRAIGTQFGLSHACVQKHLKRLGRL